ncbi:MAG TPA: SAM-dependent methyltransferase [Clostridiales bacterium]|nr:SAM-dependent methyltransferase [Clostridiales bacterium]
MNLPKLFEDRMRTLLGEEYEAYLQCYEPLRSGQRPLSSGSKPLRGGLRVNMLKSTPGEFEEICPFSVKRIPWVWNGYYYDTKEQPSKHPYYYAGLYYIQEPSAMTPASLLPIEKGDRVLDICAAPGGKSTELGARLGGEGVLVSNDISNSRAKALLKNIELFGIRNALVLSEAPNKLAGYFPEYFDKILIDAPCSGEGMFRKSPAIMKNWEQYGVGYYNKLQKEIIQFAAKMLKPGGYMLYSTCTFSPEENEGTIAYLLEECPEFEVANALPDEKVQRELGISYEGFDFGRPEWVDGKEELKHCIRLWPHKIDGEGHFVALLHKRGEAGGPAYDLPGSQSQGKKLLSEEALDFFKALKLPIKEELLTVREDRVYLLPEGLPDLKGLRILRQGLLLGEMKKQRFEPSQALANALGFKEYDKVIQFHEDDPNVIRYLKCEAIEPEGEYQDGWYLVCVKEYPLGWIKVAKNHFKNKYLPGWRWV